MKYYNKPFTATIAGRDRKVLLSLDRCINGKLLVCLVDSNTYELVAKVSASIDHEKLGKGEFFIKDYSENRGGLDSLLEHDLIEHVGRSVVSGYVTLPVVRLTDKALAS